MKRLIATLTVFLLIGAGCATPVAAPPIPKPMPEDMVLEPAAKFNEPLSWERGQTLWFEDGLSVTLADVNDSRCKPDVVCIWAGELAYQFALKKEAPSTWTGELRLGTTTMREASVEGYIFKLIEGTESGITMTVAK
jgi:hypothetical protein